MIKLSTIIPIYNKERWLRRTLQSIVDNHEIDEHEYECLLIDDDSPDKCADICMEFCNSYGYFKYIKIPNDHPKVASTARNVGIDLSRGQIIHFIDADDVLCSNFYGECVDKMLKEGVDILVRSQYIVKTDDLQYEYTPTKFDTRLCGPPLQCSLFSRKIIGNTRFENIAAEDIIFTGTLLMNNNFQFLDERDNFNSFIYFDECSESKWNYGLFGMDYDHHDEYIVGIMQKHIKYPYKLKDGEIKLKGENCINAKRYLEREFALDDCMLFGGPDLNELYNCTGNTLFYCVEVDIINHIKLNESGYFDFTKDMVDVGAGIGEYPSILSFNHNYIFEPDKRRLWMCHANLLNHNKWSNSTTYQMALSDEEGKAMIMENSTVMRQEASVNTLDSYGLKNVGFIKIDVEGFEEQVIRGAVKTIIENNFPPILFECWPVGYTGGADMPRMTQETRDRIFNLLRSFGYEILENWGDWETHLAVHKSQIK